MPKFGILVVFTTLMVYSASIAINAANVSLIDGNKVEIMSDTNWVFAEIVLLFSYMSNYVLNPALNSASTWLIGLLIIVIIHAFVVGSNYQSINMVTDDATRNID